MGSLNRTLKKLMRASSLLLSVSATCKNRILWKQLLQHWKLCQNLSEASPRFWSKYARMLELEMCSRFRKCFIFAQKSQKRRKTKKKRKRRRRKKTKKKKKKKKKKKVLCVDTGA